MFTNLSRFFVDLRRGHVLCHKNGGIFLRRMSLVDSVLVKMCKFFLKKVAKKFGLEGKMVVPLQPQTGNGGSLRGNPAEGIWRNGKKSLPLQNRPFGGGERTLK